MSLLGIMLSAIFFLEPAKSENIAKVCFQAPPISKKASARRKIGLILFFLKRDKFFPTLLLIRSAELGGAGGERRRKARKSWF